MNLILAMLQAAQPPIGFDLPLVTGLAGFIALPVKVLVDVIKGMWPKAPPGFLPPIGLVIGFLMSLVVLVAIKQPLDSAIYAQCTLAAVGAQVGAMAASALQNKVNRVEERVDAALAATPGTTKAEINDAVRNGTTIP
jgi:hypothetical protein